MIQFIKTHSEAIESFLSKNNIKLTQINKCKSFMNLVFTLDYDLMILKGVEIPEFSRAIMPYSFNIWNEDFDKITPEFLDHLFTTESNGLNRKTMKDIPNVESVEGFLEANLSHRYKNDHKDFHNNLKTGGI